MNLVDEKILHELTANPAVGFDALFNQFEHPRKHIQRPLLAYLDKVLTPMLDRETPGLRCSHIHFPELSPSFKDVILEFFVIRSTQPHKLLQS